MKTVGLWMVIGLAATACSKTSDDESLSEAKSSLARDLAPNVSANDQQTLVNDNGAFAVASYRALFGAQTGNAFFSPYSISSVLAMAYAGARGTTATEIATALQLTLPSATVHPAFDAIDLAINAPPSPTANGSQPFTMHVANSMWGEKTEKFEQPFLDTLATDYGSGVFLADFAGDPGGSENLIDRWVSDQTNAKIPQLLKGSIDSSTRVVLVDAIYFNAGWQRPFDVTQTTSDSFTTASGGNVTTPMMHDSFMASVAQTATYDAVEIPYSGNAVMDVVMPKPGTLAAFEASLTADVFSSAAVGTSAEVTIALPKFGYQGAQVSLTQMLRGLGMSAAFTKQADFTGITADSIHIDDVIHQAFLRVDEQGTEAAAATAETFKDASVSNVSITVDHPFLFAIREKTTGSILFLGRITDPTQP